MPQLIPNSVHAIRSCRRYWSILRNDFGSFAAIESPGTISSSCAVPSNIRTPEYWPHGTPTSRPQVTEIKSVEQIQGMKVAGRLAREIMDIIAQNIQIGTTTDHLDKVAHNAILERQSYPSPLHYKGFPKSICTSVNNVACHGIPDDRPLQPGDIISADVTVYHDGYHGDCCETWCLPGTDSTGERLVECARCARDVAISACKPGVPFATIGALCEETAEASGLWVLPMFIGHGIGSYFHGPPDVYHYANTGTEVMAAGMTFTVEPIVAQGGEEVDILGDGWTALTRDGGRAAQFEHTLLITDDGHEILTDYIQDTKRDTET